METPITIFWFRRDLRLDDNIGMFEALYKQKNVLPIFIFDSEILSKLKKDDARVTFIHSNLQAMRKTLQKKYNSSIAIYHGSPLTIFKKLIKEYTIRSVYTNHDYEPYATKRDHEIETLLKTQNIEFKTYKDHIIFEKDEILKKDNTPYKVYTPYMKRWKEKYRAQSITIVNTKSFFKNLIKSTSLPNLSLEDIGFTASTQLVPKQQTNSTIIQHYENTRNFPAKDSTSRLGPHLRFGTISIRKVVKKVAEEQNEIFLQELIWREFFTQILWHYPYTATKSFKSKYDRILWRNNEEEFNAWCNGKTGYPLVDAGMQQLNQTGFMHNRVRMVVGSFLCKHLLIDWRWGEAYFAEKLQDYDMASNIGNWQWVAGCGVDAAPYFRIFNPTTQIQKFDKDLSYIKKWVPELQELTYPLPIVDHKIARDRCLETYKSALN
jgi:deoxyribodipyrimidine photo-lyase